VLGQDDADIEDLFEPAFLVDLVNVAYQGALSPTPLTVEDLPEDPRMVRRVRRAFEARGVNGGRFSHYAPAAALLRTQTSYAKKVPKVTLDRAEALIHEINALITD